MAAFARSHSFSLHAFLADETVDRDAVSAFADEFQSKANGRYTLAFQGHGEVSYNAGSGAAPASIWQSRGNILTAIVSDSRVTATFDALAHAELRSEPQPSAQDVLSWYASAFARGVTSLGQTVNRLSFAIASVGVVSPTDDIQVQIARKFLNEDLIGSAERKDFDDTLVRLNRKARWLLDADRDINQLCTVSAEWVLTNKKIEVLLKWSLDINSSPFHHDVALSEANIVEFYNRAAAAVPELSKQVDFAQSDSK